MADVIAEGPVGSGNIDTALTGPPQDRFAWELATSLIESARSVSSQKTASFAEDYRFFLGENHYPTPENYRAVLQMGWRNQGVRNWLFATIDHKAAVILDPEPNVHISDLNGLLSFVDRVRIGFALKAEARRVRWNEIFEDAFFDGAVVGKGLIMFRSQFDKLSQSTRICAETIDPTTFYHDPSASRLSDCRYVVWEPVMDISDIRAAFPDKADLVVADASYTVASLGSGRDGWTLRDAELPLVTSAGEFTFSREGAVTARKAKVGWVWIKDETLVEDIEKKIIRPSGVGVQCISCGSTFEHAETPMVPDEQGGPSTRVCPDCGSAALMEVQLPEVSENVPQPPRRLYPHGRLIVRCGTLVLYDGPNPEELEEVFPFVEYNHYRIPRRFWGYGDVALLRSSQRAANRIVAMALDYLRLAGNGPFEYPADAEAYTNLGAVPGQIVPVPSHLSGMAHWVHPSGYDVIMHQILDAIILQDFQRVGGVTDVSTGVSPSSPTSGVEVRARQAAASTRLGQHMRRLNQARSDFMKILWQMMVQHYQGERSVPVPDYLGNYEAIRMNVASLPPVLGIEVTANPDDLERDNLMGQNLAGLISSGGLLNPAIQPFLDVALVAYGLDWSTAREIQQRVGYLNGIQSEGPSSPGGESGNPPTEEPGRNGGPTNRVANLLNSERAMAAYGGG